MSFIPTLDISDFDLDRERFVAEFGRAYEEWGFAGITGHQLDQNLIKDAFAAAEAFFAMPDAAKNQYQSTAIGRSRGYVPFGTEKAKDAKHSDLKEFYHIGRERDDVAYLAANVWPSEIAHFQSVFETLYASLELLANRILEVAALYLTLPQNYFRARVARGEALLRVLHYPPILDDNIPNVRAAAHEDINLITLLVGSEQEGLEVLSKQGDWVPISMIEGTVICNVGDMMQRLTNGQLRSTTHRVVNPKGEKARTSRYSMPFFMHPNPDVALDCLPECISDENPIKYSPITADEYLKERLRAIGLLT